MTTVEELSKESEELKINNEVTNCLEGKLKAERERKELLERFLHEEKEKITKIKEENTQLKVIANVCMFGIY